MAKRTTSSTLVDGKGTTKRLGMNTRAVTRQTNVAPLRPGVTRTTEDSAQLYLSAQYPPGHEDSRSEHTENNETNVSATASQREERPAITTEPAPEPLPPSRESTQESRDPKAGRQASKRSRIQSLL